MWPAPTGAATGSTLLSRQLRRGLFESKIEHLNNPLPLHVNDNILTKQTHIFFFDVWKAVSMPDPNKIELTIRLASSLVIERVRMDFWVKHNT
jgi:hypothetical protein